MSVEEEQKSSDPTRKLNHSLADILNYNFKWMTLDVHPHGQLGSNFNFRWAQNILHFKINPTPNK